nr:MAG TPA: hypothetical protein [Bacteriophage sp.]
MIPQSCRNGQVWPKPTVNLGENQRIMKNSS